MLFLAIVSTNFYAQDLILWGFKSTAIMGGKEGKLYAARIESALPKKDLIKSVETFLRKNDFIEKDEKIKIDEMDDSYTEFTIPAGIREPMDFGRSMGMGITHNPVIIEFDIRFEFDKNGSVLIIFQDFKSKRFTFLEKDYSDKYAGNENLEKFSLERGELLASNSLINQAFQFITDLKTPDQIQQETEKIIGNIDERFKLYDKLVKDGIAAWLTGEDYIANLNRMSFPGEKNVKPGIQKMVDEQRLLDIPERRWEEDLRPYFELLIKNINIEVKGKITNILEDGKDTWEIVDGLLVPTDKKLQKKYLKNKMSF